MTWTSLGDWMTVVSLLLAVLSVGLAFWAIRIGRRGEGVLKSAEEALERQAIREQRMRLVHLSRAILQVYASVEARDRDAVQLHVIEFVTALKATRGEHLPACDELYDTLKAAGDGKVARAEPTNEVLTALKSALDESNEAFTSLEPVTTDARQLRASERQKPRD